MAYVLRWYFARQTVRTQCVQMSCLQNERTNSLVSLQGLGPLVVFHCSTVPPGQYAIPTVNALSCTPNCRMRTSLQLADSKQTRV